MNLTIDPTDPTPPYEQLRRQLSDLITAGRLAEGQRLPPVRQLAGDLGLAVGTVARTYAELELAGMLISRRGGGTRVAAGAQASADLLGSLVGDFLRRARELGYPDDQTLAAVTSQITSS